jgi:hypothetical protein
MNGLSYLLAYVNTASASLRVSLSRQYMRILYALVAEEHYHGVKDKDKIMKKMDQRRFIFNQMHMMVGLKVILTIIYLLSTSVRKPLLRRRVNILASMLSIT